MNEISVSILKLCLVGLFGFYLKRRSIITDSILDFFTDFIVRFSVPFLIFSYLIEQSEVVLTSSLFFFLLLSFGIFFLGFLVARFMPFVRKEQRNQSFSALLSFQNAGYLPMNIAFFLFSQGVREKFLVYIFLYLLGFNIIMWSVGSHFVFRSRGQRFNFRSLFNPPTISTLCALLFIYTRCAPFIPKLIVDPLKMIGNTTFVLSMIVLGAMLAKTNLSGLRDKLPFYLLVSSLKLIIMPLIFFFLVSSFGVVSLLGVFIVLEAAMPSAVSLPIVARLRGAATDEIAEGVFFTHLLSIISIPVWLTILRNCNFSFA